jgi:transcription initiation factor IIF auxiliary subunit
MVHDNKTDDTYTKNDVDSELARRFVVTDKHTNDVLPPDGEFHVDLYTLPDQLIKMLWDFTSNRVNMNELA